MIDRIGCVGALEEDGLLLLGWNFVTILGHVRHFDNPNLKKMGA